MRKMLLGCAAVLVATSAQANYLVTVVDHATRLGYSDHLGTLTVDVRLDLDGLPGPSGGIGFSAASMLLPRPAGWTIGDVIVDPDHSFDPIIPPDPRVIRNPDGSVSFSFTADQAGGIYTPSYRLASVTLLASALGTMTPEDVVVVDELSEQFGVESGYVAVSGFTATPEPASLLLLLGALALFVRRR